MSGEQSKAASAGPWDVVIVQLHVLRRNAGDPSFSAIGRAIAAQRLAAGADEYGARVATSTVHYAFRLGRTRINLDLTREIVQALGASSALIDEWLADAGANVEERVGVVVEKQTSPLPQQPAPSWRVAARVLAGCVAMNLLGREFVDFFGLPIHLDMVGTAIAAIVLGPWLGAAVGGATNLVGVIGSGWVSLPFALVNIVGALLWGYGVRRWAMGRTLPRFFALNVLVAVACSVLAVPILAMLLHYELRAGSDVITLVIGESVDQFAAALGFSNLLTSLLDKLVSGFVALVVISALPVTLRHNVQLPVVSEHAVPHRFADAGR